MFVLALSEFSKNTTTTATLPRAADIHAVARGSYVAVVVVVKRAFREILVPPS